MRAILCCVFLCSPLSAQRLLFEQASSGALQCGIVVPDGRFDERELLRLARENLQRETRQKVISVFMATTDEAVSEALTLYSGGEREYLTFAVRYLTPGWASWGMAEAIRIGSDAVLRIRYPDGRLGRLVLQGRDPLVFGDGSEVIHIHVPPVRTGPPQVPPVFFVRTSQPLSESTCNRIVADLRRRSGLAEADVRIRNDHWFITDPQMPVRYAFWERQQIPGPVDFIEGRTALCGWDDGGRLKPPQIIYPTRKPKYRDTP